MCGIAGIMFKKNGSDAQVGKALIDMLDGCQHRGPDSTGFALYYEPQEGHFRLRFFIGEGDEAARTVARIKDKLRDHQARIVEETTIGVTYACVVQFRGDLQSFAYDMEHAAKVFSLGQSLDIVKDIGGAHDVDGTYAVEKFHGSHGIGHVRLATESDVSPDASHPFWATGFADVAHLPRLDPPADYFPSIYLVNNARPGASTRFAGIDALVNLLARAGLEVAFTTRQSRRVA